jgi:hypothetical protein
MSTEATEGDGQQRDDAGTSGQDARELVERLRSAPAEEIITDLFSTLLSTAQVKLGRRDARLFIDLAAQALESAGRHLSDELRAEVETALGQLRLAQVSAEGRSRTGEPEPNDLLHVPTSQTGPAPTGPAPTGPAPTGPAPTGPAPTGPAPTGPAPTDPAPQPAPPTSKLWVPGR